MGVLGGALAGVSYFLTLFGPPLLNPTNIGWLMRYDSQVYYLAFAHFRREPWHWPPGVITGIGHPVGTSIGNTDAVPLVAFPLKFLDGWLPEPFQFLGWWLLVCFVLQGVFGALLARQLTTHRLLQALAGTLFVLAPALHHRIGHAALCAHWTLLAALWLLLADDRLPDATRLRRWVLLAAVTAAIQPYLAVVVVGLGLSCAVNPLVRTPGLAAAWRRATLEAAAIVAATGAAFWVCGFFTIGVQGLRSGGFGIYSMNLLSPVIALDYGRLLPSVPMAQPGQTEGFIYFGAGWLGLAAVGLVAGRRRGALPPLGTAWAVVAVFTLLAVGPVVAAGDRVLLDVSAWSPPQLDTFRSAGRFGWIVMYMAFAASLRAVLARFTPRAAGAVLSCAIALQLVDMRNAYAGLYQRERSPEWTEYDNPLKSPAWDVAMSANARLVMAPPDMCGGVWPDAAGPHLPFSMLAARHRASVNSGFSGRFDADAVTRYCRVLQSDIERGILHDDTLYVVSASGLQTLRRVAAPATPVCGTLDGFTVCATTTSFERWRQAAARHGFQPAAVALSSSPGSR